MAAARLGRYHLLAQLAGGENGIAYRAWGSATQTNVEVRVPRWEADSPSTSWLRKRLRLAALLDHPAALRVIELHLDDQPPYLVLESTEGSLDRAGQNGGRMPLPQALMLLRDCAAALAAAHRLGLAHGRLCPASLRWAGPMLKVDFAELKGLAGAPSGQSSAAPWQAPEHTDGHPADPAADVYSLGAILCWLLGGRDGRPTAPRADDPSFLADIPPLRQLIDSMLAVHSWERPSAASVQGRLTSLLEDMHVEAAREETAQTVQVNPSVSLMSLAPGAAQSRSSSRDSVLFSDSYNPAPPVPRRLRDVNACQQLGRFRVLEKLGEGGMGTVFRGQDLADGSLVALKVLKPSWIDRPEALQRFRKEARLLAEVRSPYVTNLLEVNEDDGIHYLVLELVSGKSLRQLLSEQTRLDEWLALTILADVARALAEAHRRAIVHRDVKPENILLLEGPADGVPCPEVPAGTRPRPRIKLSDFGLARHVVESPSLDLTQVGATVGTPLYMAPEQCSANGRVDARSDVYAMGATLFHLLAGRPPFVADDMFRIIAMHCNEAPPPLQQLNPAVSDGAVRLIEKALAKDPDQRHADAEELLANVERLLRGEVCGIAVHPRLPQCPPHEVLRYDFVWDLQAPPQRLWPHVVNTERLNRAIGLPAVDFTVQPNPHGGTRRHGQFRVAGMTAAWEEHPFEWVEGQRMGVLRQYSQGPFAWLVSVVELTPRPQGGTTLRHQVQLQPRGLLGRFLAPVEVGYKARRALQRVYHRIDAAVRDSQPSQAIDPFEPPPLVSRWQRRRLDRLLDELSGCGLAPDVVEGVGDFLASAPAQEVARIRPLALARRLGFDPQQVVAACLHGARIGLLMLLWDVLCPLCRIPADVRTSLRQLDAHAHCPVCAIDYDIDFASSVEMIFRAHPDIRDAELGTYCVGGPAHFPHVAAQVRLAAGEQIELDLHLAEGAYRLRSPQLPRAIDFRVDRLAATPRWAPALTSPGPAPATMPTLRAARQQIILSNESSHEIVLRLERTLPREDVLTAAHAASLALFRELFPQEALSPGQLVQATTITALVTELERIDRLYADLGDVRTFAVLDSHFQVIEECIARHEGAVVRRAEAGVLAVFDGAAAAVEAGLQLQSLLSANERTRGLGIRVGIHRGPALASTRNERLDYFGATLNQVAQLPALAGAGEVILTDAVAGDPQVAALLAARGLESTLFALPQQGPSMQQAHRLRSGSSPAAGPPR